MDYEISKIATGLKLILSYSCLMLIDFIASADAVTPDVRWLSKFSDAEVQIA